MPSSTSAGPGSGLGLPKGKTFGDGDQVDASVMSGIEAARTGGVSLSPGARQRVGTVLGDPLDDVRVHADSQAAELAQTVSAKAFTVGRDVFFASGEYRPGSSAGDALIAHEAAHVVQQRNAPMGGPLTVSAPSDDLEVQADAVARAVATGQPTGDAAVEELPQA